MRPEFCVRLRANAGQQTRVATGMVARYPDEVSRIASDPGRTRRSPSSRICAFEAFAMFFTVSTTFHVGR